MAVQLRKTNGFAAAVQIGGVRRSFWHRCLGMVSVMVLLGGLSVAVGSSPASAATLDPDTFPGAPISNASGSDEWTTVGATAEAGEPANHVDLGWASPDDFFANSIWYSWTAPEGVGMTYFDLEVDGGYVNPALGVYTGDSLDSLAEVAYNQYAPRLVNWNFARVVFTPSAGTTYRIGVGSKEERAVTLRWGSTGTAPDNDSFANGTVLADDTGDTTDATFETGEPTGVRNDADNLSDLGGHSVWYTYTPSADTDLVIDLAGSDFDTFLGVYTGSLGSFTTVTFNDDHAGSPQSLVRFTADAATTYYIGVGGYGGYYVDSGQVVQWGEFGYYVLDVAFNPTAPSVNLHPESQTVTSGLPASFTAAASGDPAPIVQWQESTTGSYWYDITDATDTTYTIASVTPSMSGYQYRAVFTNSVGTATTNAAILTVEYAPSVTVQPLSTTIVSGIVFQLTARASGNPAPAVQWQLSTNDGSTWSDISGATTWYYSTTANLSMNGYQYRAVFSNIVGTTTTNAAILNVSPSPASVTDLSATTSKGHITVTFTGTGDPQPTEYQCMLNVKKNPTWVACVSGDVFKSSAKTVSVQAFNTTGWGPVTTVTVTRA